MPSLPTLAAFAVASTALILLPGPAMLFLLARGVAGGRRVGILSALGVNSATTVYVLATAAGLTALLATSALALTTIRSVGAAYLVVLGVRAIRSREDVAPLELIGVHRGAWVSWRDGFLVGIANPKVVLFFVAFFPQFVSPAAGPVGSQVLVLGTVLVVIGAMLDTCYGVVGGAVHRALRRRRSALRRGRVVVGLTYVGLGGLTAVTGHRAA